MKRIVRMLPGNRSVSPVRIYQRVRTTGTRKDAKRKDSSGSSSSSDVEDERSALLKTHDRQVECLQIPDRDDLEDNIYSRNYDSHRARRRTICRQPDPRARIDDVKLKYPHEKKFTTKQLPRYTKAYIFLDKYHYAINEIILQYRYFMFTCINSYDRYLQGVSKDTAYFEVDEIRDSRSLRRCVRPGDSITSILHSVKDKNVRYY